MTKNTKIGEFLKESRIPGSTGSTAKKITVKLYGKGVFAKQENRPGSENTSYYKRKAGQFIYSKLDFLNGAFGIIPEELDGYESTVDLPCFDFVSSEVSPEWFLQFVSRSDFYSYQGGLGNGGRKARRISPDDFLDLEIEIPPLPEQKKIAEILSGIDSQITLWRHSFEKLTLLERATIKGTIDQIEKIDSNCRQLSAGAICRKIFVGIASSTTHAYTDKTGIPMLRNQNIKLGTIDSGDLVYIKKDFAEEQKSKRLLQGDVITARTGYPGASAVVGREFEDCHSFTTLISRVEKSIVIPEYYSLYLNSPQGKAQVTQLQAGGAQENLNVGALEKMIIPIPDLKTQDRIVKASEELLKAYKAKESVIRKYERLKEALSSDLLSGRKRVSV